MRGLDYRILTTEPQMELQEKIYCNALENPDLPVDVVRDLLIAKEEQSEPFSLEDQYDSTTKTDV